MMSIVLQGYIVVPDDDLVVVKDELISHVKLTRQEEGCLSFRVSQDPANQNIFYIYEKFVNRYAFDFHQQRLKKSYWTEVAVNVERHYQITEVN